MSRTELTVTTITRTGVDSAATLEAANADGEAVVNNGATFIEVLNTDAADCDVTVVSPRTVDGLAVADLVVTVSQNERMMIGPFPKDTFNNQSGDDAGKIYVNFEHVNNVTIAAWRM